MYSTAVAIGYHVQCGTFRALGSVDIGVVSFDGKGQAVVARETGRGALLFEGVDGKDRLSEGRGGSGIKARVGAARKVLELDDGAKAARGAAAADALVAGTSWWLLLLLGAGAEGARRHSNSAPAVWRVPPSARVAPAAHVRRARAPRTSAAHVHRARTPRT